MTRAATLMVSMQLMFCCDNILQEGDRAKAFKESGVVAVGSDRPCIWPPDPFVM